MDKRQLKVTIEFDCECLETSPVLGKISDKTLSGAIEEFFKIYFTDAEMHPEEGDFYTLSNPVVASIEEDYKYPLDDESILAEFKLTGVTDIETWLPYEKRVRELQNEGMTRGDAQGVADMEGLGQVARHMAEKSSNPK